MFLVMLGFLHWILLFDDHICICYK